jgi:hypothetical protein
MSKEDDNKAIVGRWFVSDAAPPLIVAAIQPRDYGAQCQRHQLIDALLWPAVHEVCQEG